MKVVKFLVLLTQGIAIVWGLQQTVTSFQMAGEYQRQLKAASNGSIVK